MSVINGAQTVGSIGTTIEDKIPLLERAQVLCRLIAYKDSDDSVGHELTRACNTQNAILAKDFISLDQVQKQLDVGFSLIGKKYVHRSGEEAPESDEGCTIDEATIALACQNPDVGLTVIAKTKISRLWTDEKVYRRIFTKATNADTVWRYVLFMRDVDKYIKSVSKSDEKLEALSVHGNRFLLHCMFQMYSKILQKSDSKIDMRTLKANVLKLARELSEKIEELYPDSPKYSLFKNNTKTKILAQFATKQKLA